MPLPAGSRLSRTEAVFFSSLQELDTWAVDPSARLDGIQEYRPRRPGHIGTVNPGVLLGESPFDLSYTFNFWSATDTFVYFSLHRVVIPPPGWITAAHRHGTKMLGTITFEGTATTDCLRLLIGNVPMSRTGPAAPDPGQSIPLSSHYARILADLAFMHGFDGYLLYFACKLNKGIEQAKTLSAWITLLRSELRIKIGPHAQAIWFDSMIYTGQLQRRGRLDGFNLPFFLSSTAIYTNNTWPPRYPNLVAQYFRSLDPSIVGDNSAPNRKSLSDIYMGVDVWGHGSYGGGGFGSYKAISRAAPDSLGLSVALFGPSWTRETERDKPGWTWEQWWAYERRLWIGSESEDIRGPEVLPDEHFKPITSFFPKYYPPDPSDVAFHTTFCPGVGRRWFVDGGEVLQPSTGWTGWTDVDKQCSLGDMVWQSPSLTSDCQDQLFDATASLCLDDAWNGGSSLRLRVSGPGVHEKHKPRHFWLPIQSLSITVQRLYEASVVFKPDSSGLELGISVKPNPATLLRHIKITNPPSRVDLPGGWTRLSIQFHATETPDCSTHASIAVGLTLEDPAEPFDFSILVGQLNVFASPPPEASTYRPFISWADFKRSPRTTPPGMMSGVLSWDTAVSMAATTLAGGISPEDPAPVWTLDPSDRWFPTYLYFNIYAEAHDEDDHVAGPEKAAWIGTTGFDGKRNSFTVDVIPPRGAKRSSLIRFYIQGVTEHGDVLPWQQCVFVDTKI